MLDIKDSMKKMMNSKTYHSGEDMDLIFQLPRITSSPAVRELPFLFE